MRTTIPALAAAFLAATSYTALGADSTKCHIGDAALCFAEPGCHWDVNKRGCYEGELPAQDACAAHESESVCGTSSFGCKWNAEEKKCASQPR
jgi:hypothetical protein